MNISPVTNPYSYPLTPQNLGSIKPESLQEVAQNFAEAVKDVSYTTELVSTGMVYKMDGAKAAKAIAAAPPLLNAPSVGIERPYIIVPGWKTAPTKFNDLVGKLTEGGANGGQAYYVKNGQFFTDPALQNQVAQPGQDAKVFVSVFNDNHQPPNLTAPQLRTNIAAICKATGTEKVDVEGYSMGGLCTREYLDKFGDNVGKVMLLGTPNHGSRFAKLSEHVIRRDINFAMSLAGVGPVDLPAFQWLSAGDNPVLNDLNSRFDKQCARTEGLIIVGGEDKITPSRGLVTKGDGMVSKKSLTMPGVKTVTLKGRPTLHHGTLPSDKEVYSERAKFYGWTITKPEGAPPPLAPFLHTIPQELFNR